MKKHIVGENGISYTLAEDGIYYPNLQLPKDTDYVIGKYGRMREEYLKEHHYAVYINLLLDGKLNEYLHEVDEECHEKVELLVKRMAGKQGVTEQMKVENQMLWVGMMNNLKNATEEIVFKEIIFA